MKILLLDKNHPLLPEQLSTKGFLLTEDFTSTYEEILKQIEHYDGIIIRSRITIDKKLIEYAKNLKFIARVGAGMENIDVNFAQKSGIKLISSPEGNRDAVAEQVLGMLLILMNRLFISSQEVKNGIWKREENRGDELLGKTVGLIGYGNMGKATAKRLSGFGCKIIFHDLLPNLTDEFATQVSLDTLKKESDLVSLHLPMTEETHYFINEKFISEMAKNFYFINTARGKNVKTKDLVQAIKMGKIKGAALDVLEFEKASFEKLDSDNEDLQYLLLSEKVIITPHIAGWTIQSKEKLAQIIVDKIVANFPHA
jgi:D-3-phosphoglycerate dehydrogenase